MTTEQERIVKRFRGIVERWSTYTWDRIALIQEDGFKVDLIGRVQELAFNYGEKVEVRYWTSTARQPDEVVEEGAIRTILGALDVEFEANEYSYSEYTSGVYYDTEFKAGGHDMFAEMCSHEGKYIIFEIAFLSA